MSTHLLIEGPSGVGKSTLILNRLGALRQRAGGFVTQRMVDETGETRGFCLTQAKKADTVNIPYQKDRPGTFIRCETKLDSGGVFLSTGMELLKNTRDYPFILVDEIGGVELLEPIFFSRLTELFEKEIPCIGVLKSRQNCEQIMVNMNMPDLFIRKCGEFRRILQNNPEVEIVRMNRRNIPEITCRIDEFAARAEVRI